MKEGGGGRRDFLKWIGAGAAAGIASGVTKPLAQLGVDEIRARIHPQPRIEIPTTPDGALDTSRSFEWFNHGLVGVQHELVDSFVPGVEGFSFNPHTGRVFIKDSRGTVVIDEVIPLGEKDTSRLLIYVHEDEIIFDRTSPNGMLDRIQIIANGGGSDAGGSVRRIKANYSTPRSSLEEPTKL